MSLARIACQRRSVPAPIAAALVGACLIVAEASTARTVTVGYPQQHAAVALAADEPPAVFVDADESPWYCASESLDGVARALASLVAARDARALRETVYAIWRARGTAAEAFFAAALPGVGRMYTRFEPVVLDPPPGGSSRGEVGACYSLGELEAARAALLEWADELWLRWLTWRPGTPGATVHLTDSDREIVRAP